MKPSEGERLTPTSPATDVAAQIRHRGDLTALVKRLRAAATCAEAVDLAAAALRAVPPAPASAPPLEERLKELAKRVTCSDVHEGTLCAPCRADGVGCLRAWACDGQWPISVAAAAPPRETPDWAQCEHTWAEVDGDCPEHCTPVRCSRCRVPGERNNKTQEVFWPAT